MLMTFSYECPARIELRMRARRPSRLLGRDLKTGARHFVLSCELDNGVNNNVFKQTFQQFFTKTETWDT